MITIGKIALRLGEGIFAFLWSILTWLRVEHFQVTVRGVENQM